MLILTHIKLLFCTRTEKEFFFQLYYLLGFYPNKTYYYQKAFTHKSSNNILGSNKKLSNERLEFLGDSIIDSIIADYLFNKYPDEPEGFLTKMKSKIVNRKSLNQIALNMKLHSYLQSNISNVKENDALGNAFEALIGAIYLDKGYSFTKQYYISNILEKFYDFTFLEQNDTNYKSQLIEYIQKKKANIIFTTDVVDTEISIDNHPNFKTIITIDEIQVAIADGNTKKEAEQNASKIALENYDK